MIVFIAGIPVTALAETTTGTTSEDPNALPPFQDILKEYELEYYTQEYVVTQDGNDYYFYSIEGKVPMRSKTDHTFDIMALTGGMIYKFSAPNYYLKPTKIPTYATGDHIRETRVVGDIIASSYDIKTSDGSDVVFTKSSSTTSTTRKVILKGAITDIDLKQSLAELVALLPILLPCVICYLSIRKGVRFTLTMLRTA